MKSLIAVASALVAAAAAHAGIYNDATGDLFDNSMPNLDIQSVQHDSMTGHWLLPLLVGGGPAADCSSADAGADAAAGKSLHR